MKRVIKFLFKVLFFIIKWFIKIMIYILSKIFGLIFGWIPDFDERMSGEDFEKYVKDILKHNGFKKLCLTKKTGDYGIDILGVYHHQTYAIQCKKYRQPVGVSAIQQAYAGCKYYECDIPVVVTNSHFTSAAISMAEMNGVELWDGKKLKQLMHKANSYALLHRHMNEEPLHPYHDIIELLLANENASVELLTKELHYSEEKAYYILDDLEFYELVSCEDLLGMREILFESYDEAIQMLEV